MTPSAAEQAARLANALNDLGHLALDHPMEDSRRSKGDAKLRDEYLESVTECMEMVNRTLRGPQPGAFPNPARALDALTRMKNVLPSVDWDDAVSLGRLREDARQALEALGFELSGQSS
ncbi:hypothetical protein JRI60_10520 [Archangium violaceum]|uniref:hypothetical protein n=1 Tax=Archangium violaceum TaxID=83451 RepID=UPI00195073CE|nr:hypothetical protein [Archangium violaceum]QRN99416.1 hypothetical protein JRI60_10520 [Archangium violaceum]